MRKLRIGYFPISRDLKGPGDRRRLIFWAKERGHTVIADETSEVDLIVATANSDFHKLSASKGKIPKILDLVDGYLAPTTLIEDLARGMSKKLTGQIGGGFKAYRTHLTEFCEVADAVICSSSEQANLLVDLNRNIHTILDSHQEFEFYDASRYRSKSAEKSRILWEGQPSSLLGFLEIDSVLANVASRKPFQLKVVTDLKYFKTLNRFFETDTRQTIETKLVKISHLIDLIPWSLSNLNSAAPLCQLSLIPTDLKNPMVALKPENRLLIMWRLGLPCLTSPSPANIRVAREAGTDSICENFLDWENKIQLILSDPNHALRQLTLGQKYLLENHSKTVILKKWDDAIASVL